MTFMDWLLEAGRRNAPSLRCVSVIIFIKEQGPNVSFEELKRRGVTSAELSKWVSFGYLYESGGKYSVREFWKDRKEERASVSRGNETYRLYTLWKKRFSPEVPTSSRRVQMLAHAKRLLKNRDIDYWEQVMDIAAKDPFWKNAVRGHISALEKAAQSLVISKPANKDLESRFEKLPKD